MDFSIQAANGTKFPLHSNILNMIIRVHWRNLSMLELVETNSSPKCDCSKSCVRKLGNRPFAFRCKKQEKSQDFEALF